MNPEHTFEEALARLEEITSLLEKPDVSLEEGLALYREGAICARLCREKLASARHELEIWKDGAAVPADESALREE